MKSLSKSKDATTSLQCPGFDNSAWNIKVEREKLEHEMLNINGLGDINYH